MNFAWVLRNSCRGVQMKTCGPMVTASRGGRRPLAAIVLRRFLRFRGFASAHTARWGIANVLALMALVTIAGSTVWAESELRTENESVRIRRSFERTTFS